MIGRVVNDPKERVNDGLDKLAMLAADGSDLGRPRLVTHSFSGSGEGLEQMEVALRHVGYTVQGDGDGDLTAEATMVINEPWLRESMTILCRVADRFGVTYHGFEAHADRSEGQNGS